MSLFIELSQVFLSGSTHPQCLLENCELHYLALKCFVELPASHRNMHLEDALKACGLVSEIRNPWLKNARWLADLSGIELQGDIGFELPEEKLRREFPGLFFLSPFFLSQ